ncbi:MAG: aminotransferase [Dethiosulfovibrio peptidovorans]|nr:MAG: aminotransferase [Dethiosulfovibrio peptidovorans]
MEFSQRVAWSDSSDVAAILKAVSDPEILSLAGGIPAPELFPVEEVKAATTVVIDREGGRALQYSSSQGDPRLRSMIARRMAEKYRTPAEPDQILITNGSQQALDIAGKVFLDEGSVVLCESPTYLGALGAFRTYGARFIEVETDDDGMVMEDLERKLRDVQGVRLVYVNPDFQNPTGIDWSVERRRAFARLVGEYDVPAVEDNPYGELRFEGACPPSIKSFDEKGTVISLGSFSKIFCPGMRVAWMMACPDILMAFMDMKQNDILCSSTLHQAQIVAYDEMFDLDAHVRRLCDVYKKRLNALLEAVDEHFPQEASVRPPLGGLFAWVSLPEGVNAREIFAEAVTRHKVAFVPGGAFFAESGHENFMRLNFSAVPEDRLREGIRRLGLLLRQSL